MARDRGGAGIEDALRRLDDWVEQSAQVTRQVAQQAEVERKGPTTDDGRGHER